jgi:hypothetical protein
MFHSHFTTDHLSVLRTTAYNFLGAKTANPSLPTYRCQQPEILTDIARLVPIHLDRQFPLSARMPWDTDARNVLNTMEQNWNNVSISTRSTLTLFRRAVDRCPSGCEQVLEATLI